MLGEDVLKPFPLFLLLGTLFFLASGVVMRTVELQMRNYYYSSNSCEKVNYSSPRAVSIG